MPGLVSILIPAFNAGCTLRDTLRSAIAQTWPAREIIVVNDGSTDDTAATAGEFASQGVTLVTQGRAGAAAARNKAFSLSKGDYIQWLDADDLLAPNKIEEQMGALEGCSERTVLSGPWGRFWHRPSHAVFSPTRLWSDLTPVEWLLRKMEDDVWMQTATWLVPRRLTEAAGPWDTRLLGDDDGEYFCRILSLSDRVRFVPDAKVFYRVSGPQSLSYIGHSSARMDADLLSKRLHIRYLLSMENSPRARRACVQALQDSLINYYPERLDLISEAESLARELGGRLEPAQFSWKYAWLAAVYGPRVAKRAQLFLPRVKWAFFRLWDRTRYYVEKDRARLGRDTQSSSHLDPPRGTPTLTRGNAGSR